VVQGGSIYTSTDSGASWTARTTSGTRNWYSITSSSDGTKLAAAVQGGSIYTSTDSGATWVERTTSGTRNWYSITSSTDGTKLAAVVLGGSIYTSNDSGVTWVERDSARNWVSITSSADGTKLAALVYADQIYTSVGAAPVITYTAPAGTGSASFTFQVQDDASTGNLDLSPNTLTFNHTASNTAPTDIALTNTIIPENNAPGATIGTLTATDANVGDTHTFSLISGEYDNADFTITGNILTINASADYETKSTYAITIRATDSGGLTYDARFLIDISDDTIPQTIAFNDLAPKTFGDIPFTVSATGGASGQPVTFSIFSGPASIAGSTVTINGAGTIIVRAQQAGAGDYSAATAADYPITVAKAPQTITFTLATTALTTDTVTLTASGGASGLSVSYSIVSGPGALAGNSLTFTGPGAVVVRASQAGTANYLAAPDVSRTITASTPPLAVTTPTSADITATTATLGGNVTGDGGFPIGERGIVYSLTSVNANPRIGGNGVTKVTTTGTTGVFTVAVTGLVPNSAYSFIAYAVSGDEHAYTSAATFTTASGETVTIGGTTVLAAANIGTNATVPELLTGQTIITGTVKEGFDRDSITFTLPPGKAVTSGMLVISDYVAPVPIISGAEFINNQFRYRSASALNTGTDSMTNVSVPVTAPTRCDTNTFTITLDAPLIVRQPMSIFGPTGPPVAYYGSASYVLTLEIGDQATDSTLSNLSGNNPTTLSPAFAPATMLYTATIPYAQTRADLLQTVRDLQYATVSVNGGTPGVLGSGSTTFAAQGMNVGLNTIVYRVCAQNGTETTYTVNVTREPNPNLPPTFSGYAFTALPNDWSEVAKAKILARAADADGGTLSITAVSNPSAQGGLVFLDANNIRYAPANSAFRGLDTFTVTISDGQGGSVTGTITVNVADPGVSQNQAQISVLPGGNVALLFMGIPGQDYTIERSTDLQNWTRLSTITAAPDGTIPFTDTAPPPGGSAFYRTAVPQG
jgi:hypothetical protein